MKHGRTTKSKTHILDLITASTIALSHTEIQSQLVGLCDRVTIYRVLDRLTEEGFIHKIVNFDGVIKYAKCNTCDIEHYHDHVHFSCESCKEVICIENVVPKIKLPSNYEVHDSNFVLSGICPNCK